MDQNGTFDTQNDTKMTQLTHKMVTQPQNGAIDTQNG
jgi:hypothetical protein